MSDRMDIMKRIQKDNQKSYCPKCGTPNKCSMEQGKSVNICWCFTESFENNADNTYESCLCKTCFTKNQMEN